jgi:hypothetical protein
VNLTTATPAQIDTALAPIWSAQQTLRGEIDRAETHIRDREARGRMVDSFYTRSLEDATTKMAAAKAAAAPLEAEYTRRGGWTRFYMVMNAGGHLHASTYCSTCRYTTAFSWLPEYSGQDEAGVVDLAGEDACTVCFPTAPVNQQSRLPFRVKDRAEKEAAATEREAKRQVKLAKAINVDGSEWKVQIGSHREYIKTIRAAELLMHREASYALYYPGSADDRHASMRVLAEKIQERTGRDATTLMQEISAKAHKKYTREQR